MSTEFEVEVSQRSRISVACPEPDAEVQESYGAEVRRGGALVAQVEAVFASYSAARPDDPEVSFPEPITFEPSVAATPDVDAVKEAIKDKIITTIKTTRPR